MKLFLQAKYTIVEKCYFSDDDEIYFNFPIEDEPSINIKIITNKNQIEAYKEVEVDSDFLKLLEKHQSTGDFDNLDIFEEKSKYLSYAVNQIVYSIRFFYNWGGLDKNLISSRGIYWSTDNINWFSYPTRNMVYATAINSIKLSKENSSYIQAYIDGHGWEPFVAFEFLDKAKDESNPAFKWINATIAAELAIKEFLIRNNPDLEKIILEIPSPPLHKLFGSILESIVGEKSPKLKSIQKGVETRNKLVHRPNVIKIDIDKANQYVEDIELALFHLLSHLYKDDPFIRERLNPKIRIIRE